MPKTKPRKPFKRITRQMKAFIIAFAAVITAAYAPQTGPFKRILPPPPNVPFDAPVTLEELHPASTAVSPPAPANDGTAKRRVSDRDRRPWFKPFRPRQSNAENRRHSPRRRFSFFFRFRKGELETETQAHPDPPSCPITP